MTKTKVFGFVPSEMDGTEQEFKEFENMDMPEEYSYIKYLSPIINQGKTNTCVPSSISAHINWNKNVDTDGNNNRDNHFNIPQLYASRKTPGDNGMTFKEALSYLLHNGIDTDFGNTKIEQYALIRSKEALKQALLLNGPCVGGLMVYNMGPFFWDKNNVEGNFGGHAISIVGYTKEGFIIRNSWGTEWGDHGYSVLDYDDFDLLLECWTIID